MSEQYPEDPVLPPMNLVRTFEATCRLGSMRRAAASIGISHSVASRNIRDLEAWMGVKLLVAGPRGINPTREGTQYYQTVRKAFGLIGTATEDLRAGRRGVPLRIGAVAGLAGKWLTPRLPKIQQIFNRTEVQLRSIDPASRPSSSEMDLLITFGNIDENGDTSTALISPRVFPVINRRWLADYQMLNDPRELANQPLIHEGSRELWGAWLEEAGAVSGSRLTGPILSNIALAFDAADSVKSPVLATRFTLPAEEGAGQFVELFDTDVHLGWYILTVSPQFAAHPALASFISWMKFEMGHTEIGATGT